MSVHRSTRLFVLVTLGSLVAGCTSPAAMPSAEAPASVARPTMTQMPTATPAATSAPTTTPRVTAPPSIAPEPNAAPTPPPLRLPDDVEVAHDEQVYQVEGTSAADLLAAMQARGPTDDGAWQAGLTSWRVSWRYRYAPTASRCRVTSWTVSARVTLLMPTWDAPAAASPELVRDWREFVAALRLHERTHEQNGLDRAGEAAGYLDGRPSAKTCKRLERLVDRALLEIVETGKAFDEDYDRQTGHGQTQGATWPP